MLHFCQPRTLQLSVYPVKHPSNTHRVSQPLTPFRLTPAYLGPYSTSSGVFFFFRSSHAPSTIDHQCFSGIRCLFGWPMAVSELQSGNRKPHSRRRTSSTPSMWSLPPMLMWTSWPGMWRLHGALRYHLPPGWLPLLPASSHLQQAKIPH